MFARSKGHEMRFLKESNKCVNNNPMNNLAGLLSARNRFA